MNQMQQQRSLDSRFGITGLKERHDLGFTSASTQIELPNRRAAQLGITSAVGADMTIVFDGSNDTPLLCSGSSLRLVATQDRARLSDKPTVPTVPTLDDPGQRLGN